MPRTVLKNEFSRNFLAIIPDLTTNSVSLVISSSSITIVPLDAEFSGWRILKRASERFLKVYIPGSDS